ncbi:MAG: phage virion morphogenesis protein [Zoogloea sp.]|uniref:phage virion morphogenesis protein n=1 Tax=Zoogloea sp. TaxID=49181 RepID=UPI0026371C54|nr:phage virion morphogenesis protein [Zoogloea sp.]MDD3328865.1 phage virion morphogenesis protein [Zoogloea sp.]
MSASVRLDTARVTEVLARLAAGAKNPAALYKAIGEELITSTRARFATSTAPDGSRWAPNSRATFEAYLARFTRTTRKDGRLNAKGSGVVMGKRPLVGQSRQLATQIYYNLTPRGLEIGSPMEYAAMQQFGGSKAEFPHLWGDIPARPFLGLSAQDEDAIEAEALAYLGDLLA